MNTQIGIEDDVNSGRVSPFTMFSRLTAAEVAAIYGHDLEKVERILAAVRRAMQPLLKNFLVTENGADVMLRVTRTGIGEIITDLHGHEFWHITFTVNDQWGPYHVLWHGDMDEETWEIKPKDPARLLMRTDSGCKTGQVFHDATCDCRQQLHQSMAEIGANGEGLIVHIPEQDGRGMGLTYKLATLILQRRLRVNTVESARMLIDGDKGVIDCRTYAGVVGMIQHLGFHSGVEVNLATNNPAKLRVFTENGYRVEATPVHVAPTEHTRHHFAAKAAHLGHNLPGGNTPPQGVLWQTIARWASAIARWAEGN